MKHFKKKGVKKIVLSSLAAVSLSLGFAGIVLPVLPTTPFVILAAALYSVSDPERAKKLEQSRIFGEYLRHWKHGEGIALRTKVRAITVLWVGLLVSMYIVQTKVVIIVLSLIGSIVSAHLIGIKTKKEDADEVLKPKTIDT